jgi:hypothetical protein
MGLAVVVSSAAHPAAIAQAAADGTPQRCEVVLGSADADSAWKDAVREAQGRLDAAAGEADCGHVDVRTDGRQWVIVFTTRDGRHAERPVLTPGQLAAIVEAMAMTLPNPAQTDPPPVLPTPTPADVAPATVRAPAASEASKVHVLIQGFGGVRFGSPASFGASGAVASPSFSVGIGLSVGPWELGVFGQSEPTYVLVAKAAPQSFAMSSYGVGVRSGYRHAVGSFDAVAGVAASLVVTNETSQDIGGTTSSGSGGGGGPTGGVTPYPEPRVGLFAAAVLPRHARVRFRPELAFDAVASRIGNTTYSLDKGVLPPLPWWSASASIGIEWEAQ